MVKKMKYALIGCGRISENHIKAAVLNNLEIVAVCDLNLEKMEEVLKLNNLKEIGVKKYQDYKEMIENENLDFVSIATESGKHAEIALYCIEKGVHVIIEKPMAMNIEDCNKIIKLSKEKNIKVCACHQNRFNKSVQSMRKVLESQELGIISHASVNVRWRREKSYYSQALWRGTWEQDGGALMNQCVHGIDLLRWSLGDEVEEVYGVTRQVFHDYLECEDLGVAIVKFKNGAIGTIEGTTNVYPDNLEGSLSIFGEKGTVKLGGIAANTVDIWELENKCIKLADNNEETKNVYGNGHTAVWADFIKAIKEDRKPYIDAIAGRNAVELVLAIYKSSFEGKAIKLPLKEANSIDFKGQFENGK